MTMEASKDSQYLMIPYALRGRDFDENFRFFTFPYFDMPETVPYYSSKDSKINTQFCDCMIYTKCQSVTVHHPITLKLLHKMITDSKSSLYLRCFIGNIGRTSASTYCDLMYKNIILSTYIGVNVHMDKNTIRPMSNCKQLLDYKIKYGNKNEHIIKSSKEFRENIDILSNKMNEYNKNYILNEIIYLREFELRPMDRDWNKHCNQAVYTKRIEDSLYEYHKPFRNGRYCITYFGHLFKHEMLINFDATLKCVVYILMHNKINNNKQQEEIIGCIKQNDTVCLEYRVIITPTHKL
eukprot:317806_1